MKLLLIWLAGISLLELSLWTSPVWRVRRAVVCGIIPSLALVSGLLFGSYPSIWTGILLFLSLYRLVNLLRILENRIHAVHLYQVTRRSGYWLAGSQIIVLLAATLAHYYPVVHAQWPYVVATAQLVAASTLFISTWRHMRTTKPPAVKNNLGDRELPTLSVAIPARNETGDLEACLRSLIASDYPKLEVLVLDDCSQNKRTPGIIREFAQHGIHFVAGQAPPRQWLAKNYAYHQLAEAANGEVLLFCGVDTRFRPTSLRTMARLAIQKDKTMLSFIPKNRTPSGWGVASLVFQPVRYAWEITLPRRLFKRPPVLSTCWLIEVRVLQAAGGFEALMKSTSPESHLARYTAAHSDGYSFMQADSTVGLSSEKQAADQQATAVRTRYPQLHRRPELVALFGLLQLTVLLMPFFLLLGSLISQAWTVTSITGLTCLLLIAVYVQVVRLTYRRFLLRSLWLMPLAAMHDVLILNYSMWQYEFREVIWKGRNICAPIMEVVPKLPKLD